MLTASPMTTALLIALILGTAGSAWLWLVHNRATVIALGLKALAAMRWRESSRFVIEALESQGFSASRLAPDADRGQNADLLLNRGEQTWLLSFKQGVDYRVEPGIVSQLAAAVRDSNASGGIVATLGTINPEVRKHPQGIELIDGATLWPLISPLLPPSLHEDILARSRRRTVRATGVAWILALLVGLLASQLIPEAVVDPARDSAAIPTEVLAPGDSESNTPAPAPAEVPAIAGTEDEQRRDIAASVARLPGIARASWATRSTLVALLDAGASDRQIDGICKVLSPYGDLRYSRVQLQPPPGSEPPVRFLQCTWN
ncbi:restriction endonuclease [Lysobacter sp. H21R4]|uniref:restriction endonuclease n=1 Tax=Lysobacter sp. H21R4 TaxID=2781021 RepID=UPI00188857BE|nr:restriction endonuclease [Lysobacter sp. H21R4]QOY61854.1 restriction endonuclease [Lysobacter sp. H21R4]